jgi:hypothetical protein
MRGMPEDKKSPLVWRRLSEIYSTLSQWEHPFYLALYPYHNRAIANAIRSGEVPVRARRSGYGPLDPFDRIEKEIERDWEIEVESDCIVRPGYRLPVPGYRQGVVFQHVEADELSLREWLRENALPAGYRSSEETEARGAGRPRKGMDLYLAELERRADCRIMKSTLTEEAKELRAWVESLLPLGECPKVETIEINIRTRYNELKAMFTK